VVKVINLNRIKVAAVSYLNTKPLLYGIKRSHLIQQMELTENYPSIIAEQLEQQQVDIALVPVAILPKLSTYTIISKYCIGATQAVASVALFSKVPIEKITHVLLDYQSKTSIQLATILLKEYWKKEVIFIHATNNYEHLINNTTAGIIIGDRAFVQRTKNEFVYDLAEAWIQHTKLPFVFAAWVANKPIDENFLKDFDSANALGLEQIENVIAENHYPHYDLATYYTKNISYILDEEKQKGLQLFLQKIGG
jgi:chorismate dehydratase